MKVAKNVSLVIRVIIGTNKLWMESANVRIHITTRLESVRNVACFWIVRVVKRKIIAQSVRIKETLIQNQLMASASAKLLSG